MLKFSNENKDEVRMKNIAEEPGKVVDELRKVVAAGRRKMRGCWVDAWWAPRSTNFWEQPKRYLRTSTRCSSSTKKCLQVNPIPLNHVYATLIFYTTNYRPHINLKTVKKKLFKVQNFFGRTIYLNTSVLRDGYYQRNANSAYEKKCVLWELLLLFWIPATSRNHQIAGKKKVVYKFLFHYTRNCCVVTGFAFAIVVGCGSYSLHVYLIYKVSERW